MKIIIYGAGAQGKAAARVLRAQGLEIYGFADREHDKCNAGCDGHRVVSLSELRHMPQDGIAVIIGIGAQKIDVLREIDATLSEWGINKIYWSAVELIEDLFPEIMRRGFLPQAIEVTTKIGCSVCCKACPQDLIVREYGKRLTGQSENTDYCMTFETFKNCADKFPEKSFVGFGGFGEPFENPNCVDMIVYAYKKGHRVAISTTCVGLTIEGLEKLKSEKVVFSVCVPHFPSAEKNENIAITGDYLKIIDEFLESFVINSRYELFTKGYFACHGKIHRELVPILEKHGMPPDAVFQGLTTRAGCIDVSWHERTCALPNIENDDEVVCDRRRNKSSKIVNRDDFDYYMKIDVGAILLPNGEFSLCAADFGLKCVFGNLTRQSFQDIFRGNENNLFSNITKIYREGKESICYKCECAQRINDYEIVTRNSHLLRGI